jgi:hypothetical protein
MTNKEKVTDLYRLITNGQLMDAFEKYYADEVVMTELGEEPRVGKELNRSYEQKFLDSIEDFHGMGIDSITADDDNAVTAVESWMDVSLKGVGRIKMNQVAVQRWANGLIIEERFYHK